MKITQELVDRIIERAKKSSLGLDRSKAPHALSGWPPTMESLAHLLVSGYDAKYDLVSVFLAALETVEEEAKIEAVDSTIRSLAGKGDQP